MRALRKCGVDDRYSLRVTVRPIRKKSALWRPYMARHRQNAAWQYHNGGIWPMVGAFWIVTLASHGRVLGSQARAHPAWHVFVSWMTGRSPSGCMAERLRPAGCVGSPGTPPVPVCLGGSG